MTISVERDLKLTIHLDDESRFVARFDVPGMNLVVKVDTIEVTGGEDVRVYGPKVLKNGRVGVRRDSFPLGIGALPTRTAYNVLEYLLTEGMFE